MVSRIELQTAPNVHYNIRYKNVQSQTAGNENLFCSASTKQLFWINGRTNRILPSKLSALFSVEPAGGRRAQSKTYNLSRVPKRAWVRNRVRRRSNCFCEIRKCTTGKGWKLRAWKPVLGEVLYLCLLIPKAFSVISFPCQGVENRLGDTKATAWFLTLQRIQPLALPQQLYCAKSADMRKPEVLVMPLWCGLEKCHCSLGFHVPVCEMKGRVRWPFNSWSMSGPILISVLPFGKLLKQVLKPQQGKIKSIAPRTPHHSQERKGELLLSKKWYRRGAVIVTQCAKPSAMLAVSEC